MGTADKVREGNDRIHKMLDAFKKMNKQQQKQYVEYIEAIAEKTRTLADDGR